MTLGVHRILHIPKSYIHIIHNIMYRATDITKVLIDHS